MLSLWCLKINSMEKDIKDLIEFYESEINECYEQISYFPNGNERIEGLIHAYNSIVNKLRYLNKNRYD